MKRLKLLVLLISFTTSSFAYQKLNSYEQIKFFLMHGKTVKVIFDLNQDCTLLKKSKPKLTSQSSIVGMTFNEFAINDETAAIQAQIRFLNAADKSLMGTAAYSTAEIAVYPNNSIGIDTPIITLPEYKTLYPEHLDCKMSTSREMPGVKFYTD